MSNFAKLLDRKLNQLERSDRWLALKINRDRSTIGNWRKGKTEPRAEDMLLVARAFGMSEQEFYAEMQKGGGVGLINNVAGDQPNTIGKGGVVEVPLFPEALSFIAGLHQSSRGLTINLLMASKSVVVPDVLEHEGMFAVQMGAGYDSDDDYGVAVCWPWEGHVAERGIILFVKNGPGRPAARQIILHENGRFILKAAFEGDNVLRESNITVLGVVKFSGRFV